MKGSDMCRESVRVDAIVPFDKNPRKNDLAVEAVARSIAAFGFNCPIIIGPDNRICAGHARWKAAKKLGLKTVPVIKVDALIGEKFMAFNIADNRPHTGSISRRIAL
ncbi:MAG: ParB N-terminal domain-containing protein [Bacteroides uniformis]|nr:ParB N-terminal domain-containing protein [Bacteroides uniformis]